MKHVVIFSHPNPKSFTATMADAYARAARRHGHEVIVRDLYGMGFDPCLKLEEIPCDKAPRPAPDIAAERALLGDADVYALFYPFWFNAPPAMMKGYIDRVFCEGFGYNYGPGGMEPLLQGKKLISITSSGAPLEWMKNTGAWRALRALLDEHLAAVCGLELLDHIHFGEIMPGVRADAVEDCAEEVAIVFTEHFVAIRAANKAI